MKDPVPPRALTLVSTYDALMADGRRVSWKSFRPSTAAAGSKPTVYFTTLAATPDAEGNTVCNLGTIGAQARSHDVTMTLLAGTAQLTLPGQAPQPLPVGVPTLLPAWTTSSGASLTFTGDDCSLKVEPQWWIAESPPPSGATEMRSGESGQDPIDPPPPIPGGSDGL